MFFMYILGQNKNFYIVCLLLYIIQLGVVDKIFMEFLVSILMQKLLINDIVSNKFAVNSII